MTKQAERDYPLRIDSGHLYGKPYNDPRVFREFSLVLELFGRHLAGRKVLDLGCGPGWTTLLLARAGYDAFGVDISDRMIEIAQERSRQENLNVGLQVADMETLNLEERDFDGVLFFDCLHHCPAYREVLRGAFEHLRPGGHVLLLETTWLHRYSSHARAVTREYGLTELGFSRRQLRRALTAAGFGGITHYHDPGPPYRGGLGFLGATVRLWADFAAAYPQAKNIVLARKPA